MSVLYTKEEGDQASTETPQWKNTEEKWVEITSEYFTNDPVVHISGGSEFFIYITASGKVYGKGTNSSGQIGLGPSVDNTHEIRPMLGLDDVKIVYSHSNSLHSFLLSADGEVYGVGYNTYKQLTGNFGDTSHLYIPQKTKMPYLKPTEIVTHVACAYSYSVIGAYSHETGNSSIYVVGQIVWVGSGNDCEAAFTIPNQKIKKIDAGSFHLVILFESGLVYTGGENALKLGRDKSGTSRPFNVTNTIKEQPCVDVCCASNETFVLTAENELYHFNNYGEKVIKPETIMQGVYASGNMVMLSKSGELYDKNGKIGLPATRADIEVRYSNGRVLYVFDKLENKRIKYFFKSLKREAQEAHFSDIVIIR